MKLSVIIPCFNEQDTIAVILDRVKNEKTIEKEIIVVDDFSNDNSRKILENYKKLFQSLKLFIILQVYQI